MRRFEELLRLAEERVLVLDGAMGTMIQTLRPSREETLNDLLCLSDPGLITRVHTQYLEAGADIIETCSFNANAVSLADYGLAARAYEISLAAARLAREAADTFSAKSPRFVAGTLGPATKSAGLSPDPDDPAARAIFWAELEAAYYDNARGLWDGGADLLLIETIFDTLNAKAAAAACLRLFEERGAAFRSEGRPLYPLILSASVADASGRLLCGQSVEAFCVSVAHARPFAVGLNCSLGAAALEPLVRRLSRAARCRVSAHPNAGLPNEQGGYDQSPGDMAREMRPYIEERLVNIAGSCCGSTPEHTRAIARLARAGRPRPLPPPARTLRLAGLDTLEVGGSAAGLSVIGEGGNAAGSRRFLAALRAGELRRCLSLMRENIQNGARLIDICADDGLLDAQESLRLLTLLAQSDPVIAKVPFVLDSSDWDALEAALTCVEGKALVNSLTLKEGEERFLERARSVRQKGGALVVMLFDERGQAATLARKTEIAARAFRLLQTIDFPPEDIVFDLNVLAVATGMPEHDRCALDFIGAIKPVLALDAALNISAGVSNLSFSFRGTNAARRALHAVFLRLCYDEGMRLAIASPGAFADYDTLDPALRDAARDLILMSDADAPRRLMTLAARERPVFAQENEGAERLLSPTERLERAIIRGEDDTLEADIAAALAAAGAAELVEGPLMNGMKEVSERYGRGEMFLPQVLSSARVMKRAVTLLGPAFEAARAAGLGAKGGGKVLLATVRGDVHDIGKNIVGIVLDCAGFETVDIGVMAPREAILEAALREKVDIIGLSGLVTPSLREMIDVADALEERGLRLPLLIGGAAASLLHTALYIAPRYSAPVVYVSDASGASAVVRALLSESQRPPFLAALEVRYQAARDAYHSRRASQTRLGAEEARKNKVRLDWA